MNTNPNRNSRHHHQQLPNQGGVAGGGNNNNVLVYINQQQQQGGVDLGGLSNISQNPNPMPPSGWVKSHSSSHHLQQGNGISSSNSNCSPASLSAGSMSTSYGASNSFNSQHQFYSGQSRPQQTDIRYSAGNNGGTNHMRPNPNYNNLSANNGMFYPVENQSTADSCQYYQQDNNFQFDHTQMKTSSCDMSNGNEGVSSNNSNFYGFYPQNSHSYHQQQDYQNQMGSGTTSGNNSMGDDTDYSRVLHQQQHYHNSHHHQQQHSNVQNQQGHNNSLPVSVQDYFGLPSSSTENSSGRHNPNYGHQLHHQHHHSTPFRRNSIESYSSEPGDLPYNAKYACNFPSTQFNSQTNSGMTKRDSMSNMSMSVPSNCNSQWSRDTNIVNGPVEQCHTGNNSHGYFFNNSHSQQNQSHRHFSNVNVNQNSLSSNFHQQQMQSFKSCSFEQQELRLDDMKPDGQVSTVGTSTKAAAVKHRSLSLSLPSSSYSRSDIGFHSQLHDQEGNLVHSHLNNSNNLSINPFDEIETNSSIVPVPVNQNSDHTSQCKLSNCVNRVDNINGDRTTIQCDNFSPNNDAEARIQQEIVESQNLVETTTLSSCPSSQSNFSNSEVSNSDSIVSACSNFPEVVTSVLDATNCKMDGLSRDDGSKTDVSLISTTTNDIGHHVDNESETDPNNSSSSCGLGLFGHSNSVSNLTLIVGDSDDSESCMSGISSFSGSNNTKISPQKISKRSFSEADKDLVINTTAVSFGGRGTVIIPKGWKRESSSSQQMENIIFYISPSGTKLRTWDELKNYICSDGTCKCGLSCPLRLEHAFSFDPKVTNLCQEEEESLLNLNETGTETRLLCNHKRKIPKSEDSPLISSTRDDLGDCGEKKSKKRRTSGSGGLNENLTSISLPKSSPSITSGHHVPVPFSQQSPDTTTQTPQTDMSPASSVSSEPSSATIFSSAGGNGGSRSTNSTPTPTSSASSSRNVSTPPAKGQAQCGFAWPPPPTSQAQTAPFWPNTTINNNPNNTNTTGKKNTSAPAKKPGYQHHLIPKVAKRSASPCPNIDVRQIPLEQNRPPPRQTPISIRNAPAAGASHPNQNPNLSFFPITSSHGDELNLNTMNLNMNTGYSISPIPNTTNNANTLQFAQTVVNANVNTINGNSLPIQIQRVITGTNPGTTTNALLPQALPSSITISMVNQQPQQQQQQQQQPTTTTVNNVVAGQNVATSSETVSEKSPLQLVQDVVNRFHSSPKTEEGNSGGKEVVNGSTESTSVTNINRKEQSSATSSSPVGSSTPNEPSTTPNEVETVELEIQIPATSSSANVTSTINNSKTNKSDDDSIRIIAETIGNKTNGAVSIVEVTNSSEAKSVPPSPSLSTASATIVSGVPLISNTTSMTTTTSSTGTVPIMTAMCAPMASTATNTIINCATTTTTSNANTLTLNALSNLSAISGGTNQPLILQQSTDQNTGQNSTFLTATSAGPQSLRYPIFQTIQPFFLNSTGAPGGSLIISPQSQPHTTETLGQQSFIYDHQSHTQHQNTDGIQPMLQQTTMVLDPNVCGNTGGIVGGPKKKKKRLSKKQQQQQAQLQLQQQLLLQQLHQQAQQQQAAATIPLTIFPQSFNLGNLGHQGFSLQPMNMNMNMNFFPTPTILTLPNLILNPADGTLFIQPSTPLSAAQQTVKLGQFPLAAAPQQSVQQPNLIAPKKDIITTTASTTTILSSDLLKTSPTSGDIGSDDSRQNATPDSSTNDLQLSLSVTNPSQPNSITLSLQPHTTTIGTTNSQKKIAVKSKAVSSSSSAVKRVFTQKQILPKIDSTTPSVENG